MKITLQQLQIFYKLVQIKHITKVAQELGLKQPTVTFHLKKLEEAVGVQLFEKKGDNFTLTPAGKMLYNYASEIRSLIFEAERVMKDYQSYRRGELLIGASHIPANYVLPPVLSQFTELHPNIHVALTVQSTPAIVKQITDKELDFAVVSEENLKDDALHVQKLTEDELVVVFSADHRFSNVETISVEELKNESYILHKQGSTREMINKWAKENELKLPIRMELSSIEAICKMVTMNTGIAIISKRAAEDFIQRGLLAANPVPNMQKDRSISLIYRKDRPITPIMQQFINVLFRDGAGGTGTYKVND